MANPEHLAILKQGVKVWNEWRERNPKIRPDLSDANLEQAALSGINLYKSNLDGARLNAADLHGANFSKAELHEADVSMVDLRWATLREAQIIESNFRAANLSEADLSKAILSANLIRADLTRANLHNADLSRAVFGYTMLGDVDLSTVAGLDIIYHDGPSTIGIDTIYKSKGNIPEVFLRGCGVPENLITFMRSLTGKAFEFYSCFISHSTKDKRFCDRLSDNLQHRGVRTWYFPEHAKWGETVWGEIDRSIKIYDKLIVVCSENSLQSGPVLREIERALNREDKEGKSVLFPVRIDSYIFDKWEHERKADVLRKVIGDFSEWDSDATKYEFAFEKLLKGLEAE